MILSKTPLNHPDDDAFLGFVVQDQVDATLAVQVHILGTVAGHLGEAQNLEDRLKYAWGRRSQFDEFEAHQAHWIVEDISHVRVLICSEILLIAYDVGQKRRCAGDASHAAGEEVTYDQLEPMVCHMDPFSAGLILRN